MISQSLGHWFASSGRRRPQGFLWQSLP